jgi:RNA recognition motif-containing protein
VVRLYLHPDPPRGRTPRRPSARRETAPDSGRAPPAAASIRRGIKLHITCHDHNPMSLFVNNLPYDLTEDEFRAAFLRFGAISRVTIASEVRYGQRVSRGYGFVDFEDPASLDACVSSGVEVQLKGRCLAYREARPQPVITDTAFVSGLTEAATDETLAAHFAPYAPTEVRVVHAAKRDRLGFGYAKFASEAERDRAIAELHGSIFDETPIVVRAASRPFRSDEEQRARKRRYF